MQKTNTQPVSIQFEDFKVSETAVEATSEAPKTIMIDTTPKAFGGRSRSIPPTIGTGASDNSDRKNPFKKTMLQKFSDRMNDIRRKHRTLRSVSPATATSNTETKS